MLLTDERAALLVVDMQEGLFSNPQQSLHQPDDILARLSGLVSRARLSGVPVIFTQFYGPPGSPLESGSVEGDIHHAIAPRLGELVIRKDDSDAFLRTELHQELIELGVSFLVVCGLQSEFCIDSTCRSLPMGLDTRFSLCGMRTRLAILTR